jgi:hypothetical protein
MVAILVSLFIASCVLLYAFAMFDHLVRAEYEQERQAWEADGRPRGFFWSAPECTWARSAWARSRLSFVWLFETPPWAATSAACRGQLRRLRICVLVWNVTVLGLLMVFALWKFR